MSLRHGAAMHPLTWLSWLIVGCALMGCTERASAHVQGNVLVLRAEVKNTWPKGGRQPVLEIPITPASSGKTVMAIAPGDLTGSFAQDCSGTIIIDWDQQLVYAALSSERHIFTFTSPCKLTSK